MGIRGFISLDVETANADFGSICAVGLAQFHDGQLVRQITILVDPEDDFSDHNIRIHGIRPEHVAGRPTMARVFPAIAAELTDAIVTHHSPFDRGALARAAKRYGVASLDCHWIDTVAVAKRTWRELKERGGFGLKSVAQHHGIVFSHHDAAEDARASGEIMLRALDDSGLDLEDWIGLLDNGPDPQPDVSRSRERAAFASRKAEAYARYAANGQPSGPLNGEVIVFTGTLSIPRIDAAALATMAGCDVADQVTSKSTILVVGDQDLRLTKGKEKSSKHLRAERLMAAGAPIRIVRESDFMLLVQA